MAQTKRCPHCGASNPETARWCSLCHERFVESEPEPAPVAAGEGASGAIVTEQAPAGSAAPRTDHGAFQVTEDGIRWVCSTCGTSNGLELSACPVCGASFADTVRPKPERPQVDPAKATLFSLFFPGAGHAYMGMWGQAIARGVLSFWVLLVTVVGILDKKVPGSLLMAAIFGIVALVLWLVTAHDTFREASNEPDKVLLKGKRFLYLVLGLMALLFVVMFIALMTARSRSPETLSIPAWLSTSSPISTEQPTI